jgi:hypothetical protein
VRRNLTAWLLTGFACATVLLVHTGVAHVDDPPDAGASKQGTGNYGGYHDISASSGGSASHSGSSVNLDPNEYICVWVQQVNSVGYEYSEPIPAGQEGLGEHMNEICGKRSEVRAALGQADPAQWLMDNCTAPCGATYGRYRLNPPTPREQAQTLLTQLGLSAPTTLHTSPDADRLYVRFPTWFWVDGGAGITEPKTKSTPDGFVSITAVPKFEWSTGEGTVSCPDKGTPYDPAKYDAAAASPDCGHTYARPGHYTLSLTVNWTVTWSINGVPQGQLGTDAYTVSQDIDVNEIQGIVTDTR